MENGVNGFVVPEGNSRAIEEKLSLILTDSALRDRLSRNAQATMTDWDNEHMVSGFLSAIEYVKSGS